MQKDLSSFNLQSTRAGTPDDATVTGVRVAGHMPQAPGNTKDMAAWLKPKRNNNPRDGNTIFIFTYFGSAP